MCGFSRVAAGVEFVWATSDHVEVVKDLINFEIDYKPRKLSQRSPSAQAKRRGKKQAQADAADAGQ